MKKIALVLGLLVSFLIPSFSKADAISDVLVSLQTSITQQLVVEIQQIQAGEDFASHIPTLIQKIQALAQIKTYLDNTSVDVLKAQIDKQEEIRQNNRDEIKKIMEESKKDIETIKNSIGTKEAVLNPAPEISVTTSVCSNKSGTGSYDPKKQELIYSKEGSIGYEVLGDYWTRAEFHLDGTADDGVNNYGTGNGFQREYSDANNKKYVHDGKGVFNDVAVGTYKVSAKVDYYSDDSLNNIKTVSKEFTVVVKNCQ